MLPAPAIPCNFGDFKFTQLVIGGCDLGIAQRQVAPVRHKLCCASPVFAAVILINLAASCLIARSKTLSCQGSKPFLYMSQLPIYTTAAGHLCSAPQPIS